MISNTGGSVTLASIWGLLKLYGAEIGTAVGAAGTVYGWWKFVWSRRKKRARARQAVAVGDRLMATAEIEGEGYEDAVAEYRKALALDRNVDTYRRIMIATRRKLELQKSMRLENDKIQKEISAALTGLYEFQTSDALKNDKGLLIEEIAFLGLAGKSESALATARRARELYPDDPEILARLGYRTDDVEVIGRAIRLDGKEPRYHYELADVLKERGQLAEAIREYRRTAELATGSALRIQRMRNFALSDLLDTFKRQAYKQGGILAATLDMPLDERVQMLEYFLANYRNVDPAPYFFLAELHHARGEMEKASLNMRKGLGDDRKWWDSRKPMLKLYARILQDGQLDPATLAEVRAMLGETA